MPKTVRRFRRKQPGERSAPDLLRECGTKLTDRALWNEFQERFQRLIFLYLHRALRHHGIHDEEAGIVADLGQEVYLRLLQHEGRILKDFRGDTEYSVMALLGRISANVVTDYHRHITSERRRGQVVPIDFVEAAERGEKSLTESREFDASSLTAILSWIDVQRIVEADPDQKNARRNALIFKLHYIDGFSSAEIARVPGFELTKSGVDTILARLRKRIQE
jgi:RNA polymerase sigma factor (sigma-70 family)